MKIIFQLSSRSCPVKGDLESDFELDFEVGLIQTTFKGDAYYACYLLLLGSEHQNKYGPIYPKGEDKKLIPFTTKYQGSVQWYWKRGAVLHFTSCAT